MALVELFQKVIPSSRIRTSDLRITMTNLQSSALPTELSKEDNSVFFKAYKVAGGFVALPLIHFKMDDMEMFLRY